MAKEALPWLGRNRFTSGTVSRYWHLVPLVAVGVFGVWLHQMHPADFFATNKDSFSTAGALLSVLGIATTFIEVVRAGSTIQAISTNRDMSSARARAVEMRRVVEEIRSILKVLDAGSIIGSASISDVSGRVSGLVPEGTKIGGETLTELEKRMLALAGRPAKPARDLGISALGEIRRFLENEEQKTNRDLDKFIGVRNDS